MNKKVLAFGLSLLTVSVLVVGLVFTIGQSKNEGAVVTKSAYQLYCESHPDYKKSESEWLDDLINGRLGDKDKWTVTFNSNGGSLVDSQIVLDGEKIKEPVNPTRLGYTFQGWLYNGQPWVFFGYSVTSNITLTANWSINTYSIKYDYNGGTISFNNPSSYNVTSDLEIETPLKEGYTFNCWIDEYGNEIESIVPGMTGDLILTANWIPIKNQLNVQSDDTSKGHAEIIEGEGYTGEEVMVCATSSTPYVFKAWFDENDEVVSFDNPYIFDMPAGDTYLTAKFDETRELTLNVSDSEKGYVVGAGEYVIDGKVIVRCELEEGAYFKGWYDSDNNFVSSKSTYLFYMPSTDYSLTAVFMNDTEIEQYKYDVNHGVIPSLSSDGKTLTYGMYPQSVVGDAEIVNVLETITTKDENGYIEYNGDYYLKKYIAIYHYEELPDPSGRSFDDGEEMINGDMRWFKVEPIEWEVISNNNDTFELMTTKLIEKQKFHPNSNSRIIDNVIVYANNYKYSYVREWLNNSFLNKAFFLNDSYLIEKEIDNSPSSTGSSSNIYACDNTIDKVYLPSVHEIKQYLTKTETLACKTTDYTRSSGIAYDFTGINYRSDYWTRSPDSDPEYIDHCKRVTFNDRIGRNGASLDRCIRPCINIVIK